MEALYWQDQLPAAYPLHMENNYSRFLKNVFLSSTDRYAEITDNALMCNRLIRHHFHRILSFAYLGSRYVFATRLNIIILNDVCRIIMLTP